jgi:hypothetical protein
MKNIEELVKKIADYKNKWIKVVIKDYNFVSYFKVLDCKFNKSELIDKNNTVDNVCITYSKGIAVHKQSDNTKPDYVNFSNKKDKFITGSYDSMSVFFLKEYPKNVINRWVKKLEKDLNTLKSIQ